MPTLPSTATDLAGRARWIARAGWLILLLSAASALLPLVDRANGEVIIATLLIAAGIVEILAGSLRHETRKLAMLAGALTVLAGLLFATEERTGFLSTLSIIAAWLVLRGIVLGIAATLEHGSVRTWTGLSAAMDLALGVLLVVGLSVAAIVVNLFGATPDLIASFAWFLALSFVVNGLMLLEVASVARQDEDV
jgi:uncharacterized membrane protein HdeD (DUF308 family)